MENQHDGFLDFKWDSEFCKQQLPQRYESHENKIAANKGQEAIAYCLTDGYGIVPILRFDKPGEGKECAYGPQLKSIATEHGSQQIA